MAVKDSDTWPLALVVPVIVAVLLLNSPPAPLEGAVNVTKTFATGLPNVSSTVATRGALTAVLTVTLWGEPEATAMLAAVLDLFVRLNVAGCRGRWLRQ